VVQCSKRTLACNNWIKLLRSVSLSCFSLAEAQSKNLEPILIRHRSPRFYHRIMFELWGAQKYILFHLSQLSDYTLCYDLPLNNFLRNLRLLALKAHSSILLSTKQLRGV
jgi:hypothetical protein